jgi:spermidine/putrescine transport system permease protein
MSSRRSPWLTLSAILVYCFLYLPIVVLVIFAFNSSRQNVVFEGIVNRDPCGPFYWFCRVFQNQDALDASVNTLKIAIISTLIATTIGTMAALALQRHHFKLKLFAETSLYIPIVIPEIVMGIGILVLFNALFKFINTTFDLAPAQRLGLGLGTVIISHVAFSVPFVALTVRSVEEAAADLGANAWTTFRRVTLPLIMPGVLAGAMLAFTLSLDDFIITFFTNGPGSTTLPIYVYGLLRRTVTPEVNALSTMWILVVLIALFASNRVQRRVR